MDTGGKNVAAEVENYTTPRRSPGMHCLIEMFFDVDDFSLKIMGKAVQNRSASAHLRIPRDGDFLD